MDCAVPPDRLVRQWGGLHTLSEGACALNDGFALMGPWKAEARAEASPAMRCASFTWTLTDRAQGAMCPGGFRLWPQAGYWNHGEVCSLSLAA